MVQTARPTSDVSAGTWTTTPLYSKVNDQSDSTLIRGANGDTTACQLGLATLVDPEASTGHTLRIRAKVGSGSSAGEKITVELRQGTTLIGTPINAVTVSRTTITEYNGTLTGAEADAITDYSALRAYVRQSTVGATEYINVYEVWFEVPDIPTRTITPGLIDAGSAIYAPTLIPDQLLSLPLIVANATPGYAEAVLADGPSAYWRFGEASGDWADQQGGGAALVVGSPTHNVAGGQQSDSDGAAAFAGSPDAFNVLHETAIDLGNTFSIEFWVKRTRTGVLEVLLDKGWSIANAYRVAISAADKIQLTDSQNNTVIVAVATAIADTNWHHVALVKSGSMHWAYLDGSPDYTDGTDVTLSNDPNSDLRGVRDADITDYFVGSLDELAFYKSVLGANDVAAHWAARVPPTGGPELYAPGLEQVGGGTTKTVTVDLLDGASAIYAPTLVPGPVGVSPGLIESTSAIYDLTLLAKNSLAPDLLTSTSAIYAPSLTPKNTLTVGLLGTDAVIYAPTLVPKNGLVVDLIESPSAIYAPSLAVGPVTLAVGLIDAGAALYAPELVALGGLQTIEVGLLDGVSAIYAPSVMPDQFVTVGLLDGVSAIYAPTLVAKNSLTVGFLDAGSAIYAPTLAVGPVGVSLGLITSTSDLYAPDLVQTGALQTIVVGLLDAGSALYAPTVMPDQFLTVGLLDGTRAIYAPTLAAKYSLTVGLIQSSSAIYAPSLAVGPVTLSPGLIDAGRAIYAPALTVGGVTISVGLIESTSALYAPTLTQYSATQSLTVGFLDGGAAIYAVTLAVTLFELGGTATIVLEPAPTGTITRRSVPGATIVLEPAPIAEVVIS